MSGDDATGDTENDTKEADALVEKQVHEAEDLAMAGLKDCDLDVIEE